MGTGETIGVATGEGATPAISPLFMVSLTILTGVDVMAGIAVTVGVGAGGQ